MFPARLDKEYSEASSAPSAELPSQVARHASPGYIEQALHSQRTLGNRATRSLMEQPRPALRISPANDPLEHEANQLATQSVTSGQPHPVVQQGLSRARFHTGGDSATSAASLDAAAYTVGNNIVFGAGQYQPNTPAGQHLIAHEAVHVAQQAATGQPMLQRQPAENHAVQSAVPDLNRLSTAPANPAAMTERRDDSVLEKNAPDPASSLPFFIAGDWDGNLILKKLGQYDRLPGTDSDADRCVQAVGMAARIPSGPAAVTAYLKVLIAQGWLTRPMTDRKRTAIKVLHHTIMRIDTKRATYGDLAWAQEAMHGLFYDDDHGTPLNEVATRIAPPADLSRMQPIHEWCDTPSHLLAHTARLQPGEQLVIESWSALLNAGFDKNSPEDAPESTATDAVVNGQPIHRIAPNRRPLHSSLDSNRDNLRGHQLLIMKDPATNKLRLYEPESTDSGEHLEDFTRGGPALARLFKNDRRYGSYYYIQVLGKLQPAATPSTTSHP